MKDVGKNIVGEFTEEEFEFVKARIKRLREIVNRLIVSNMITDKW